MCQIQYSWLLAIAGVYNKQCCLTDVEGKKSLMWPLVLMQLLMWRLNSCDNESEGGALSGLKLNCHIWRWMCRPECRNYLFWLCEGRAITPFVQQHSSVFSHRGSCGSLLAVTAHWGSASFCSTTELVHKPVVFLRLISAEITVVFNPAALTRFNKRPPIPTLID